MEERNFSDHNSHAVHYVTPRDLLTIAFRHQRLVVLSFIGILSGAILAGVMQPNRYDAEMKILVKRDRVDPIVTPQATGLAQATAEVTESELNSEVELLKSRKLFSLRLSVCRCRSVAYQPRW